jgi:hypothetical protein
MTPEEAFEALVSDENLAEMNRISEIADPMDQGYETARTLSKVTGQSPKQLAFNMIRTSYKVDPKRPDSDIWRDLGVLRWCLVNWEVE